MSSQQEMDDILNNPELSDAEKKVLLDEIRLAEANNAILTGQLWADQEKAKRAEWQAISHLIIHRVIPGNTINFAKLREEVESLALAGSLTADDIKVSAIESMDGPFFYLEGIMAEIKK